MKHVLLSILFISLLAQPFTLLAQGSSTGVWGNVQAIPIGTKVWIETKDVKKFNGPVKSVSDTEITLTSGKKNVTVSKNDVRQISTSEKNGATGKNVAIGAGIGAGVGIGLAFVLLAATGGSDSTGKILAKGTAIGAGIGAGFGAIFSGGSKKTVIYMDNR